MLQTDKKNQNKRRIEPTTQPALPTKLPTVEHYCIATFLPPPTHTPYNEPPGKKSFSVHFNFLVHKSVSI